MDRYESVSVRNYPSDINPNTIIGFGIVYIIFFLFVTILLTISWWKIFVKAQKPGWASLIPCHVTVVSFEIAKMPGWYFFLLFVPFINIYIIIKFVFKTAEVFGKSTDFAWGMLLFPYIFYPILALGSSEYLPSKPPIFKQPPGSEFSINPTTPPTFTTTPQPTSQLIPQPAAPPTPPPEFKAYGRPTGPLITPPEITSDNPTTTSQETNQSSNSAQPAATPSSEDPTIV